MWLTEGIVAREGVRHGATQSFSANFLCLCATIGRLCRPFVATRASQIAPPHLHLQPLSMLSGAY